METTINVIKGLIEAIDTFEETRATAFEDETVSEKLKDFNFNGDCPPAIYNECMMLKERLQDVLKELTGAKDEPQEEPELKVVEDE